MGEGHNTGMKPAAFSIVAATLLMLPYTAFGASTMVCTHPDDMDHTYTVDGDRGLYTWSDHGVERSWALRCKKQRDGLTACHRWEQYSEKGRSVMIFLMLPDGTLFEAGSWALLDTSRVGFTAGFVCMTRDE